MSRHGLSSRQLQTIKHILKPFCDCIERVALFGSRATGKHRPNSDIDLVLYGNLSSSMMDRIWTLFDDSALSVRVDINAYHLIAYRPLKAHIDNAATLLFTKADLENEAWDE